MQNKYNGDQKWRNAVPAKEGGHYATLITSQYGRRYDALNQEWDFPIKIQIAKSITVLETMTLPDDSYILQAMINSPNIHPSKNALQTK